MPFLLNMLTRLRWCRRIKTTSRALTEHPSERQMEDESNSTAKQKELERVAACLTIPPEPLGPPELAEARVRNSPKFQTNASLSDHYSLGRVLGVGGFAVVRVAKDKRTGQKYACKIIMLPKGDRITRDQVSRYSHNQNPVSNFHRCFIFSQEVFQEIEIASRANHPNIVSVKEFYISDKKASLVMDYLEGGMVLDSLLNSKDCRYTEDDARGVIKQVLQGLQYLHQRNVAHRDLKLENLLLARKNDLSQIKIVDFGLSKHTKDRMSSVLGTPQFVSPEMLSRSQKKYDNSVDLWSAGVLLYIFLSGFPPFYDKNEQTLFRKILSVSYNFDDPVWDVVSIQAKDLIKGLLVKDSQLRCTASEALAHPWFDGEVEYNQSLQGTRRNLLRLRRAEIVIKANNIIVTKMDRSNQEQPTEDSLGQIARQLQMEDMRIPDFILNDSAAVVDRSDE
eukprot:g6927.t1